jgi:hypothetical protein
MNKIKCFALLTLVGALCISLQAIAADRMAVGEMITNTS